MSRELSAMQALATYLTNMLLLQPGQVTVNDWPDVDKLPKGLTLAILPDRIEVEQATVSTTECRLYTKLYIIDKGSAISALLDEALNAWADINRAILTDQSLGGAVGGCSVTAADIYPAIPSQSRAVGIEVDLVLTYEREPLLLPGDVVPDDYLFPIGD